jgi:nucleoid DNA-binding protein
MEIAKYIGLYLLKNQFCYVHGLGNLELRKVTSTYDGNALQAPSYQVIVTPGGSIDDSFANFIATNEQISISKAANTLREFSTQARKDLAEGKEVYIPNIGKLIEKGGKVTFVTDDKFSYTPAGIPVIKNSKQLEEQKSKLSHNPSYPPPAKADSINWRMVVLAVVLLVILGGGGYFIYYYITESNKAANMPVPVVDTVVRQEPVLDTVAPQVDTVDVNAHAVIDSTLENDFKIVIGSYRTRERADKRVSTLTMNGNKVEVMQQDSANFFVVTTVTCRIMDTARVRDSLKVWFGYKDVTILK